jgi:hypothetical protein
VNELGVVMPVGYTAFLIGHVNIVKYKWQGRIFHHVAFVSYINHKKPQKSNIILLVDTKIS